MQRQGDLSPEVANPTYGLRITRLPPDAVSGVFMSKKGKRRSSVAEQGPFAGLYSRQILRAVVEALDLGEGHVLTGRTSRRFLRDSDPNGHNRKEFFLALGKTLQDMGFVPDLESHLPLAVPSAQVYANAIEFAARQWDAFMSRIQSEGSWDVDVENVGHLFVNLAAVDLGLRLFALNWIAGVDADLSGIPLWAEENGIGKVLRSRLHETGLNRKQFAARLRVSETTLDNWLDGRNWPGREYVDVLALEFAGGDPDHAASVAAELRRQFALAKLCHAVAETVGQEHVISVVDAVAGIARDLGKHAVPRFLSDKELFPVAPALLMAGSEFPLSPALLRFLAGGYPDGMWRDVILAAAAPWELAFSLAMKAEGGSRSSAAGLAQDYLDVVDEPDRAGAVAVREAINRALAPQLDAAIPRSPLPVPEVDPISLWKEGIAVRRRLVERYPGSPETHQHLGSFLGMVGKRTRIRRFVDEGLMECRIASGLCPKWDTPAVERGIILTNFGDHEEALRELEQVARELPSLTPHWRFAMGYVLTELERFSEGLEHLEEVIRVRPDYALAYRYAAHCAFRSGSGVKGRDYAKKARRLGDSTEFDAWQRGEYRVRR